MLLQKKFQKKFETKEEQEVNMVAQRQIGKYMVYDKAGQWFVVHGNVCLSQHPSKWDAFRAAQRYVWGDRRRQKWNSTPGNGKSKEPRPKAKPGSATAV
jgi:hypothetical protein